MFFFSFFFFHTKIIFGVSRTLRYVGLKSRQTSKPQNRRALFDVELYLTMHKSFVSTSFNIIHRGCTIHLSYPYWTFTSLHENTMSSISVTVDKLTDKLRQKHITNTSVWFADRYILIYYDITMI
jgi:hypothetical protein